MAIACGQPLTMPPGFASTCVCPALSACLLDAINRAGQDGPMWYCPDCGEQVDDNFAMCWNCQCPQPAQEADDGGQVDGDSGSGGQSLLVDPPAGQNIPDILLATGAAPPGRVVIEQLGVVVGKARVVRGHRQLPANFAGLAEVIGGRPPTLMSPDDEATRLALTELMQQAEVLGADGVVELDVAIEGDEVITATASGHAVKLRRDPHAPPPAPP